MFWTYCLNQKKKKWVREKPQEWVEELLKARTEDDLTQVLDSAPSEAQNEFNALIPLILSVSRAKTFPKRRTAQVDYLADSLAGRGRVTPRRARDICSRERSRARARSRRRIIRKEFYVECSCGYKGPARDDACRTCGAEIPRLPEFLSGSGLH
jgi:hypothetical protein